MTAASQTEPIPGPVTPALTPAAAPDSTDSSQMFPPTEEEISRLAYSYWEARVREGQPGSAEEDWFRAERDLTRQKEAYSAAP